MIAQLRGSHRYGVALVAIVLPIAFAMAVREEPWTRFASLLLFSGSLLLVLLIAEARAALRVAVPLVALSVIAGVAAIKDPSRLTVALARGASAAVFALAPVALARGLIRQVRSAGAVTLETVFGAVSIYLLVGALFGTVYSTIERIGGEPFFAGGHDRGMQDFLYFSFVTLTTTGYGDLTPATPVARTISVSEALLGQIYLVTVIALLVSNLGRIGTKER